MTVTTEQTDDTAASFYLHWAVGFSVRDIPSLMCTLWGRHLGKRTKASEWKAEFYATCPGLQRMTRK